MALKTSDDDCSITWYLQHNKYFDSIPFVAGLAWIVTKLVPGKDIADDYKPQHLNKRSCLSRTWCCITRNSKELQNVGQIVLSMFEDIREITKDDKN